MKGKRVAVILRRGESDDGDSMTVICDADGFPFGCYDNRTAKKLGLKTVTNKKQKIRAWLRVDFADEMEKD